MPICGCAGCTSEALLRIAHEDHGRLVVCPEHAVGHTVVERLGGEPA